jgi:hypothetical protein
MQTVLYGPTGLALNPQTPAIVDPTSGALRVSMKNMEYQYPGSVGGHYRINVAMTGGLTAIGAAGILASFRWAPTQAGLLAIVKRISASQGIRTAGSTAWAVALDAVRVTGFTAQHSAGGTAIAFAAGQKLRSSMGNSQAALYYATSTTVISGGTGTADANAFGGLLFDSQPVTTGVVRVGAAGDLYRDDAQGSHPVILAYNEGFYVRNVVAFGTSAVEDIVLVIEWVEAMQY